MIQIALLLRSIKILNWKRQHLRMLQFIKTINVLKWCVKRTRFFVDQHHFVKIEFIFEYSQQETCPIDQPGNKDRHKPPHWRSSYPIKIIGMVVGIGIRNSRPVKVIFCTQGVPHYARVLCLHCRMNFDFQIQFIFCGPESKWRQTKSQYLPKNFKELWIFFPIV